MNADIPALSIRQPWCWAILNCGKSVENRTWATAFRGKLRIHASKTWDAEGEAWLTHQGLIVPNFFVCRDKGEIGAYVGEVTVVECGRFTYPIGRYHSPWAF